MSGCLAFVRVVPNRVKFFIAGPVLELANPRLPGRPHQRLVEMLPEEPGRVLEICAGTGYLSRMVARAHPGADVQALDLSPEMLAVGRRRAAIAAPGRIAFVEGDAGDLPFAALMFKGKIESEIRESLERIVAA